MDFKKLHQCQEGKFQYHDPSYTICIEKCPSNSYTDQYYCSCNMNFKPDLNLPQCTPILANCEGEQKWSLNKNFCLDKCPEGTIESNRLCQCPQGKFIGLDGQSCVDHCREYAVESNYAGTGASCMCKTGYYLSADSARCISSCPSDQVLDGKCAYEDLGWVKDAITDLTIPKGTNLADISIGIIIGFLIATCFFFCCFKRKNKTNQNQIPYQELGNMSQIKKIEVAEQPTYNEDDYEEVRSHTV